MQPKDVVQAFIERINAHDIDGLCQLMPERHRFVDGLGNRVEGREQMRAGWVGYFGMVPDYWIACDEIIEHNNVVTAFGRAGGTYTPDGKRVKENQWQIPAAWRAEITDGLVAEWRVYADNEPMRRLMARANR